MIDLHTHTNESDGTCSPSELVSMAARAGVSVLAITDHDTFAGYDAGRDEANKAGIDLICGIELSTKLDGHSVHLLGYFPLANGLTEFRGWVRDLQESRRDRNARLAARLRELGFDITVEEAEACGKGMTGRPHFARIMLEKGYVTNFREAFNKYLDESAIAYVYRLEPTLAEGVQRIRDAGGVASLAHPARMQVDAAAIMPELCAAGLNAIEAYHSDHTAEDTALFVELARRNRLKLTGGSDFHGAVKPEVALGTGHDGNLFVPPEIVAELKARDVYCRT